MAARSSGIFALTLSACLAVPGCGFHLRGSGGYSYSQKLFVEGPGMATSFYGVFGNALTGAGGSIVRTPAQANWVVHLYEATYRRQAITLSRTGRATGYDLSYRIVYDLRSPKGEVLQDRREFEIKRDYFNDQTLPLAQLTEEALIREEIEKEAAQSLLRRLVVQFNKPSDITGRPQKDATPSPESTL